MPYKYIQGTLCRIGAGIQGVQGSGSLACAHAAQLLASFRPVKLKRASTNAKNFACTRLRIPRPCRRYFPALEVGSMIDVGPGEALNRPVETRGGVSMHTARVAVDTWLCTYEMRSRLVSMKRPRWMATMWLLGGYSRLSPAACVRATNDRNVRAFLGTISRTLTCHRKTASLHGYLSPTASSCQLPLSLVGPTEFVGSGFKTPLGADTRIGEHEPIYLMC